MPLNTRVGRCVTKLRQKYGYGPAIGICQRSTGQNYMTGKTIKKRRTRRKRKKRRFVAKDPPGAAESVEESTIES